MNKVSMLSSIAAAVPAVLDLGVGVTGYLDREVNPTASVMKGVDEHGRVFITLVVKSRWTGPDNIWKKADGAAIITVFQRYTDGSDTIAQANNGGSCDVSLLGGAATPEEMRCLQQLIETGKVVVTRFSRRGRADDEQWELSLISPEEWKQYEAKEYAA